MQIAVIPTDLSIDFLLSRKYLVPVQMNWESRVEVEEGFVARVGSHDTNTRLPSRGDRRNVSPLEKTVQGGWES